MGTLACIITGFEVVARNPELIVLPLLLDLFLWLGPRLSVAPILKSLKDFLAQVFVTGGGALSGVSDSYALAGQVLDELSRGFNLFAVLNPGPLLGLPVLTPTRLSALRPFGEQPAIELGSFLLVFVAMGALAVLGLGMNALYLRSVGRRVIDETESSLPGPKGPFTIWGKFTKLAMVVFFMVFSFMGMLSVLASVVGVFSMALAGLVMTLASSMTLFLAVHLMFTIPGIVQLRRGVLQAMRESLLLTRADFLNVLFLLGLVFVISQGLNVVWTLPEPESWATLIGLGGHAFVATALTAALFVFYQERLGFIELLKQMYAAQAKEAPVQPSGG